MTTRGHGDSEHRVCKRCLPLLLKVHQATTDTEGWEKRERAGNRA